MSATIILKNLRVPSVIGVYEHEKAHAEGHNSFSYHRELEFINVNIAYD